MKVSSCILCLFSLRNTLLVTLFFACMEDIEINLSLRVRFGRTDYLCGCRSLSVPIAISAPIPLLLLTFVLAQLLWKNMLC